MDSVTAAVLSSGPHGALRGVPDQGLVGTAEAVEQVPEGFGTRGRRGDVPDLGADSDLAGLLHRSPLFRPPSPYRLPDRKR